MKTLKSARTTANLDKESLSMIAGIGAGTLASVEIGRNDPSTYTRMSLERALDQRINWLMTRGFEHLKEETRSWESVEFAFRKAVLGILALPDWKARREFLGVAYEYIDSLADLEEKKL